MPESRLDLASSFIADTSRNVFLTGKAGTGKTTFLRQLVANTSKRVVVAAPTGVAALNAGGVTLHSLFQLPFGVTPGGKNAEMSSGKFFTTRYRKPKLRLIRSMDLLVIDEVSMVRSDTLDAVDYCLRRIRRNSRPFGGVQVLLIGDMNQLPPVARESDWMVLKDYYRSIYFFDSIAFQKGDFVTIELQKVFRQRDEAFIDLLEKVRNKTAGIKDIQLLNARYDKDFPLSEEAENWINLCTHNSAADSLNESRLSDIDEPEYEFEADVEGDFPESSYPCDAVLRLKAGARIMFTKNDSPDHRFVNGTLGRVIDIDPDMDLIKVCTDDNPSEEFFVEVADWENIAYKANKDTGEIEEEIVGMFHQFPLRLAWAITIHKSQGLTFDKVIIDAAASFAHGQVYVALSRCRSLEGIVLSTQIRMDSIKQDLQIDEFNRYTFTHNPTLAQLYEDMRAFKADMAVEAFSFKNLDVAFSALRNCNPEHVSALFPHFTAGMTECYVEFASSISAVAQSFENQIRSFVSSDNPALGERLQKGAVYFLDKLHTIILPRLAAASTVTFDSAEIGEQFDYALNAFYREYFIKESVCIWLSDPENVFTPSDYLKVKGLADTKTDDMSLSKYIAKTLKEALKARSSSETSGEESSEDEKSEMDIQNPELFETLRKWRYAKAQEIGKPAFVVLTQKALIAIANTSPKTVSELRQIKGIGPKKLETYGEEILEITRKQ